MGAFGVAICDLKRKRWTKVLPVRIYRARGCYALFSIEKQHGHRSFYQVSIRIMDAFVEMRKFIANNAALFERISSVELKQLE